MLHTAAEAANATDLLSLLSTASGPVVVAILAVGFWREWWVPGSRFREVQKQRDDLQTAVLEKVIPAITEANLTMRLLQNRPKE